MIHFSYKNHSLSPYPYSHSPNIHIKTAQTPKININNFKQNQITLTASPKVSYFQKNNFMPNSINKQNSPQCSPEISAFKPIIQNHKYSKSLLRQISQNPYSKNITQFNDYGLYEPKHTKSKTVYYFNNKISEKQQVKVLSEINQPSQCQPKRMNDSSKKEIKELPNYQRKKIIEDKTDKKLKLSDFEKIRNVGKGKFGQVYLVRQIYHLYRHRTSNFICAIKVIKKKVLIEEKMEDQLKRQIRIHSMLKHINIIQLYGIFDDQDHVYIVLEYAVNGSVYDLIRKNNRLEEKSAVKIVKQVSEGVKHIHDCGYIQRDIKPQNTMLQFNTVKICDFGWSTQNRLRKSMAGTPLYYSPQMVRRQYYDGSVDVWAIGILTYELIVGRIPFSIFTEDNLTQIVDKQIKFPNYIDISAECKDFILNCLQKYRIIRFNIKGLLEHKLMKSIRTDFDSNVYEQIRNL